jgi:hypothetical protein
MMKKAQTEIEDNIRQWKADAEVRFSEVWKTRSSHHYKDDRVGRY